MAKKNYDHMFSVILSGDAGVGKSKLVNGYLGDSNTNMMPTTTWGKRYPKIKLQGKTIVLRILDPSVEYDQRMDFLYKQMMGAMLVYSINNKKSFDNITNWLQRFIEQNMCNAEKILVGTNCTLSGQHQSCREVSSHRGQQLASSLGISFREIVSEDDITGINEAFETLARAILLKHQYPTCAHVVEAQAAGEHDCDDDCGDDYYEAQGFSDICSTT